jgi:hypothetical protein
MEVRILKSSAVEFFNKLAHFATWGNRGSALELDVNIFFKVGRNMLQLTPQSKQGGLFVT